MKASKQLDHIFTSKYVPSPEETIFPRIETEDTTPMKETAPLPRVPSRENELPRVRMESTAHIIPENENTLITIHRGCQHGSELAGTGKYSCIRWTPYHQNRYG